MFYETMGGLNPETVAGVKFFKDKITFLSFGEVSNIYTIRLNPRYCMGYGFHWDAHV